MEAPFIEAMTNFLLTYCSIGAAIMAFVIVRTPYDNEPDVMIRLTIRVDFRDTNNLLENQQNHCSLFADGNATRL